MFCMKNVADGWAAGGVTLLTGVCTHAPSRGVHSPLPARLSPAQGARGSGFFPSRSCPLGSPVLDASPAGEPGPVSWRPAGDS